MAIYSPTKLGRVYIMKQANFATAKTASAVLGSGMTVEAAAVVPGNARETHPREAVRAGYHALGPVSGSQGGANQLTLTIPMRGVSSSVPTDNPSEHAEAAILGSILGGQSIHNFNDGKVLSSGSDADTIAAGAGSSWRAGTGVIIQQTATDAGYKMSFIENSQSETAIELRTPMPTADVVNASDSKGTVSCFLSTTETTAFTILIRGLDNNSQTLAAGCVPTSVTLTIDPKGVPVMEATFWVNTIEQSAASSALENYSYDLPVLPVASGNDSARLVYGQSSETAFDVESFNVSIEQAIQPQLSHDATSGYGDVIVTDRTVTCSFSSIAGSVTPWDTGNFASFFDLGNTDDGTGSKAIQLTLGSTPGKMFGLHIPVPILTEVPALQDLNGMWGVSHTCAVGRYAGDTATSTESSASNSFVVSFG